MAKAVLVLAIPAGIIDVLIAVSTAPTTTTVTTGPFGTTTTNLASSSLWGYVAGLLVVLLISEVVAAVATATCYRIISYSYLGQQVDWRRALRYGASRLLSIVWIVFLTGMAVVLPGIGIALMAAIFGAVHVNLLAILVGVLGGLAWLVYTVWFGACAQLAVPILMIEDTRGWKAVRRSLILCRGKWWSVFGTQLLAGLIVGVFAVIFGIVTAVVSVTWRGSTTAAAIAGFFTRTASLVVATPFTAAVLVIIAIDLKVRKEGFDLQVLASQMGMPPTRSALSFLRPSPQQPWGQVPGTWPHPPPTPGYPPPPPGYPPTPGYPPPPPGYPPPTPGYPPPTPGYPPPAPGSPSPAPPDQSPGGLPSFVEWQQSRFPSATPAPPPEPAAPGTPPPLGGPPDDGSTEQHEST